MIKREEYFRFMDGEDMSWKYIHRFYYDNKGIARIIDRKTFKEYYRLEDLPEVLNGFDKAVVELTKKYNKEYIKLIDAERKIKRYENQLKEIEKIIDNRLDPKVVPKFHGNVELFIEEKVGYYYALEQLKKKLKRKKLLYFEED